MSKTRSELVADIDFAQQLEEQSLELAPTRICLSPDELETIVDPRGWRHSLNVDPRTAAIHLKLCTACRNKVTEMDELARSLESIIENYETEYYGRLSYEDPSLY